jgi:hypothetical protein
MADMSLWSIPASVTLVLDYTTVPDQSFTWDLIRHRHRHVHDDYRLWAAIYEGNG